jgi:hypothetical protein
LSFSLGILQIHHTTDSPYFSRVETAPSGSACHPAKEISGEPKNPYRLFLPGIQLLVGLAGLADIIQIAKHFCLFDRKRCTLW